MRRLQIPGGPPPGQVGVIARQRLANGKQLGAFALFEVEISAPATQRPKAAVKTPAASHPNAPKPTGATATTLTPSNGNGGQESKPKQKPGSVAAAAPRTGGRDQGGHDALPWIAAALALAAGVGLALAARARRRRPLAPG